MAMGIPSAVRRAIRSYRLEQRPDNTDWFPLDIPMTSDQIRMACRDDYTETVEEKAGLVMEKDKIGVQL